MTLDGTHHFDAPRDRVWAAFTDPDVLARATPGCERLTPTGADEFEATLSVGVAAVKGVYQGRLSLADKNPPESYTLTGEGSGGAAGFAKGQAMVTLTPDGRATILRYTVKAMIGGKLAQLGQRLVDGAAKKMADQFFDKFADLAGGKVAPPPAPPPAKSAPAKAPANDNRQSRLLEPPAWVPVAIIAIAIIAVVVVFLF